jgi:glycosyltransferase involved in cell wall biosynthesis
MTLLSIIIPLRENDEPTITKNSLLKGTYTKFEIIYSKDNGKGANYARNQGFKYCDTKYVLFSDNDLEWEPDAIETMINTLNKYKYISYVYGWYMRGKEKIGQQEFYSNLLKKKNFITTMSMMRSEVFPGFDENIQRLQDWDLWLNLLMKGKIPKYINKCMFKTDTSSGITFGNPLSYEQAKKIILKKYKLI